MSLYCALLARLAGPRRRAGRGLIRIASPMHDVGKIGIPDRILLKPGRLTADEREVMEAHAEMGHRILAGSGVELLDLAARDGADASRADRRHAATRAGLAGDAIPVEGRICADRRRLRRAHVGPRLPTGVPARRGPRADAPGPRHAVRRRTCSTSSSVSFDDVLAIRRAAGTGTTEQTLAIALAHASGHRAN